MRSPRTDTVIIARELLILGLTLAASLLIGCSGPTPSDEGGAGRDAAGSAAASDPAQVTVVYQPTQLCPSPAACQQGDELAWIPTGTSLDVSGQHAQELQSSEVQWFYVEYDGSTGWISEMATDRAPRVRGGKIVRD